MILNPKQGPQKPLQKSQWLCVNGALNPADDASHGLTIDSFLGFYYMPKEPRIPVIVWTKLAHLSRRTIENWQWWTQSKHFSSWNSLRLSLYESEDMKRWRRAEEAGGIVYSQNPDSNHLGQLEKKKMSEVQAQLGPQDLSLDFAYRSEVLIFLAQQ